MSNARRTLTALVVGALILAACGGDGATPTTDTAPTTTAAPVTTTEAPTDDSGLISFSSGQYPFAVHYPADWTSDTSQEGTVIVLFSPTTGTDQFSENINVLVTDEAAGFESLADYVDANHDTLETAIADFVLHDDYEADLGGEPAYVLIYSGVFDGAAIDFFQVFSIYQGLAYITTYTGGGVDFDTYLDVMLDLLDSWEWR
jgi:hypothetical protein